MIPDHARDLYECDECTLVYAREREYRDESQTIAMSDGEETTRETIVHTSQEPVECRVCGGNEFTPVIDYAAAEVEEGLDDFVDELLAQLG